MTKRHNDLFGPLLFVGLVVMANPTGCKGRGHGAAGQAMKGPAAGSKITKVVFVGKKEACACTKRRMDASWKALSQALGKPPKMPVEQYFADIDEEAVQPLRDQVRFMVVPAIYFLDGSNRVVAMLQGEVTARQIQEVLSGKKEDKNAHTPRKTPRTAPQTKEASKNG